MGETGRGFGLEVMTESKLKKIKQTKKTKLLNMIFLNFYSNSYHFFKYYYHQHCY